MWILDKRNLVWTVSFPNQSVSRRLCNKDTTNEDIYDCLLCLPRMKLRGVFRPSVPEMGWNSNKIRRVIDSLYFFICHSLVCGFPLIFRMHQATANELIEKPRALLRCCDWWSISTLIPNALRFYQEYAMLTEIRLNANASSRRIVELAIIAAQFYNVQRCERNVGKHEKDTHKNTVFSLYKDGTILH